MALVLCCSATSLVTMQPAAIAAPTVVANAAMLGDVAPLMSRGRPPLLHLLRMHPVPQQHQQQRMAQPHMKLKEQGRMRAKRSPLRIAGKRGVVVRTSQSQQQQPQTMKMVASNPLSAGSQFLSGLTSVSNIVINEALLVCVLALTAYAVLTVDSEAWRGCTQPLTRHPGCPARAQSPLPCHALCQLRPTARRSAAGVCARRVPSRDPLPRPSRQLARV